MKIIKLQGIKFRMNDQWYCFIYTLLHTLQCLLCTNDFFFRKILLPRESIFLPVHSKEDHF